MIGSREDGVGEGQASWMDNIWRRELDPRSILEA